LTFGTKTLVRNLMAAEAQKKQILEVNLARALEQLNITMEQFIDFCILSGCDYTDTLKGVGPSTAIKLIVQHKNIEAIVELPEMKDKIPANFNYQLAREFFINCEAVDTKTTPPFVFNEPDIEGLTKFLVEDNQFAKDRVDRYIERLKAAKNKTKQRPLDSFFGAAKIKISEEDKFDPTKKKAKGKAKADNKRKAPGGPGRPAKVSK